MVFKKNKILLIVISFFLTFVFINNINAQNKSEIMKNAFSNFSLGFNFTDNFTDKNLNDYTKNAIGFSFDVENLVFDGLFEKTDLGIFGRFSYQNYISSTPELINLNSYDFLGGFLIKWNLPQEIKLVANIGCGIAMSELEYMSADSGKIDDVYYDFIVQSGIEVRKTFCKTNNFDILFDSGFNFSFQNEKSNHFFAFGPKFGFIIDFSPLK